MPFDIHFRRRFDSKEDRTVIKRFISSLERARDERAVSGDLVVHSGTNEIVKNEDWLWDWEKEQEDCYAKRAIKAAQQEHVRGDGPEEVPVLNR